MVTYTLIPSAQEAEAKGVPCVQSQPGLYIKFQNSWCYIGRPCPQSKKNQIWEREREMHRERQTCIERYTEGEREEEEGNHSKPF